MTEPTERDREPAEADVSEPTERDREMAKRLCRPPAINDSLYGQTGAKARRIAEALAAARAEERERCLSILDDEGWLGSSRQRIEAGARDPSHPPRRAAKIRSGE